MTDTPEKERSFDLHIVLPRITELNPLSESGLISELVKMLSRLLQTDRVTHSVVDMETSRIISMEHVGFDGSLEKDATAGNVILKAMNEGKPQVFGNMREEKELTSGREDKYSTDGCAVLPLISRGVPLGALCISNLTPEQVSGMLVQKRELELFKSLTSMLTVVRIQQLSADGDNRFQKLISDLAKIQE